MSVVDYDLMSREELITELKNLKKQKKVWSCVGR